MPGLLIVLLGMVAVRLVLSAVVSNGKVRVACPYIIIDVETGGLTPDYALLEIAAKDSNGRTFHRRVCADLPCDPKALSINGLDPNVGDCRWNIGEEFAEWLKAAPKGWFFCGANPSFDYAFVEALLEYAGITAYKVLDYHKMDIQSIYWAMCQMGKIANAPLNPKTGEILVKVDAMAEAFGLSREGKFHSALEDVVLEEKILLKLLDLK